MAQPLTEKERFMMELIGKLHPGFRLSDWIEVAACQNISEATAKQRFGHIKKQYEKEVADEAQAAPAANVPSASAASTGVASASGAPSTHASANGSSGPVTRSARQTRQARKSAQSNTKRPAGDDEDDRGEDDDAMSPPPAAKRTRRSTRSSAKAQAVSGAGTNAEDDEDGEDENPVPPHHRFSSPKPWERGQDHYKFEPGLRWPLPPGVTFYGESDEEKDPQDDDEDVSDIFAKPPKNKDGRTPVPTLDLVRRRKAARAEIDRKREEDEKDRKSKN